MAEVYRLITPRLVRTDAKAKCRSESAQPALVPSDEEYIFGWCIEGHAAFEGHGHDVQVPGGASIGNRDMDP